MGERVIGEGENIGVKKRGRIEYEMEGGRGKKEEIEN